MSSREGIRRALAFFGLIGVGIAMFAWLQGTAASPRKRSVDEQGRPVRTLALAPIEVVPRTVGYGVVEAQREWQALGQVSGVVVETAERLEPGRIVREGTVLLEIDPSGYQLEQSKSESSAKAVRAQIAELKAREHSAASNLVIEKRTLELAEQDLERVRTLYDGGNASATEVDTAERAVLTAQKSVQAVRNTIAELPASRRVLEAQLEQQEAGVQTTQIELAKTKIVAPFTMRLREVNVAEQQLVSAGAVLLIGDGIDVFEIPAQVPYGSLDALMSPRAAAPESAAPESAAPERAAPQSPPGAAPATPRVRRSDVIKASVRLESQGVTASWPGTFRRFGGIDPTTRTMIAVVQVQDERTDGRPRLDRGLYVEVELRGAPRKDCLAIPADAFHDGRVYVVDEDDRLVTRTVETSLVQEDVVCLAPGAIAAGERVVLTELVPAVEGMLLTPRDDPEAAAALITAGAAEAAKP